MISWWNVRWSIGEWNNECVNNIATHQVKRKVNSKRMLDESKIDRRNLVFFSFELKKLQCNHRRQCKFLCVVIYTLEKLVSFSSILVAVLLRVDCTRKSNAVLLLAMSNGQPIKPVRNSALTFCFVFSLCLTTFEFNKFPIFGWLRSNGGEQRKKSSFKHNFNGIFIVPWFQRSHQIAYCNYMNSYFGTKVLFQRKKKLYILCIQCNLLNGPTYRKAIFKT